MHTHSIRLDSQRCKGCTTCIKLCPAEAIRVNHGKAVILEDRCIDCGECVRVCPSQAKVAQSDSLDMALENSVALLAPSFMGQFPPEISSSKILSGVKNLGFHGVFEVALAAEWISKKTRDWLNEYTGPKPAITSSCPVVVRLIQNRFPELIENLIPLISPMEVSAKYLHRSNNCKGKSICFISPCSAKLTAARNPRGVESSQVDKVIGIHHIYQKVRDALPREGEGSCKSLASQHGLFWALAGGEGNSLGTSYLRIDGIQAVIQGLERIENGVWKQYDLVELMSCPGGCLGGPLSALPLPEARANLEGRVLKSRKGDFPLKDMDQISHQWEKELFPQSVYQLDGDYKKALSLMERMEGIIQGLPDIDCGSCGAPTCRALAEDIVREKAKETDCIFKQREKIRSLTEEMIELQKMLPPSLG